MAEKKTRVIKRRVVTKKVTAMFPPSAEVSLEKVMRILNHRKEFLEGILAGGSDPFVGSIVASQLNAHLDMMREINNVLLGTGAS